MIIREGVGEVKRCGLKAAVRMPTIITRGESGKKSAQASEILSCRHDKKGTKHRQWRRCAAALAEQRLDSWHYGGIISYTTDTINDMKRSDDGRI